jgi:hypothetical protein
VNFRANNPVGRASKSNAQDFNRSLMLRIHNDPGTQDNRKRYQGSICASFARFTISTALVRVPMAPKVS